MAEMEHLSEHLLEYLDSFGAIENEFGVLPEERKEAEKAEEFIRCMVDDIFASRESLGRGRLFSIEPSVEAPEFVKHFLDDRFTRDLLAGVPGYVSRTLALSGLESSREASEPTNSYLREAVRTYIFGFPKASIALSRAALEQALKEELGHQGRRIFLDMNGLLEEAEGAGIIDGVIRKTARSLASEADKVLHEQPADIAKAYDVLLMLRGVLQHIYAE